MTVCYFIYSSIQSSKNPYGESAEIGNLSDFTKGKPVDSNTLNLIKASLYRTIKLNSPDSSPEKVTDIFVRDGSFSQEYTKEKKLHSVDFIVDIASLQQSYNISYQWVDSKDSAIYEDEYGTVVRCLKDDKVIYKDFKCKDVFTEMDRISKLGMPNDPILKHLPYSTTSYKVAFNFERKTLDMKVYLSAADVRSGKEVEIIDKYKSEVRDWIISKKLDPKNYENIHITIERASIH